MNVCVHVGEAKNERVRESVNPLDGCTRPFGFAEADARQLTRVVRSAFFHRDADVGDGFARGVAKRERWSCALQLLAAVARYVCSVTQAVWCPSVFGADLCRGRIQDFTGRIGTSGRRL